MKKVSFKSYSDEESSEIEPIKLSPNDIEKTNIFNNKSEIIVKSIIEKIISNVFITIRNKELDSLINTKCSNFLLQEINTLISHYYLCYEKEDYFLKDTMFINNYIREDIPWDEYNLPQPIPGEMDRWKIHRGQIVNYKYRNKSQISETEEGGQSVNNDIKSSKKIKKPKFEKISKLAKKIKEDKEKENEKEKEEENEEEKKNGKLGLLRIMDSFPSYPLSDELFKIDVNLTKEQKKQIEQYRAELLLKDEIKKKENEKKEIIKKMKIKEQMKHEENVEEGKKALNKYKGKSIGVTTNGEIIYIQNININNLKSEFLEINSRMKNYNRRMSNLNKSINIQNSLIKQDSKHIEIEKNKVEDPNLDFYKINNKEKLTQQIITGGSSFKNFIPEIGVSLKQNENIKSGGTDFLNKYKKISLEQFEKTLELFNKTNQANNEITEVKKDNTLINSKTNNNNNNSNVLNSPSLINNNNSNINNNLNYNYNYNYNYINQKSLVKSSSLPELNPTNSRTNLESSNIFKSINNINMNNDSNIKNSFYFTNYNNSNIMNSTKYNNINNFIKTSSSFKQLFFRDDNYYKDEENVIPNYTTKQFFKNFNPKVKNISSFQKKDKNNLNKIQDFNMNILKNNNWGSVSNYQSRNMFKPKPIISSVKKSYFTKTLNDTFRVRSNVNETYFRKMNIFNKISLRSQSTENKGELKKIMFDKN